jgi:lysozyme family protein
MPYTIAALAQDYTSTLAGARVIPSRANEIDQVARKLLTFKARYEAVQQTTGVPVAWLATVFEREASSRFSLYFGNGDPLDRVTTHVPKGRGPFSGPNAWVEGAMDALHLDKIPTFSTWVQFCGEGELWNGYGPRNHGMHTGYLWGGMTAYTGGKYISDGVWSPTYYDEQLGIVPVALRMIEIDPSLKFASDPVLVDVAPLPPIAHPAMPNVDPKWVQAALNKLRVAGTPLAVDGNIGRGTRIAVRKFEQQHRLLVDRGIPGPQVVAALKQALAENGMA